MADNLRIRGSNTSLIVIVDGVQMAGSWTKVEGFSFKQKVQTDDMDFLGEDTSEPDLLHRGFSVSFSIHEQENSAIEGVLLAVIANQAAGVTPPSVSLTFVKNYKGGTTKALTFPKVLLSMDEQGASDGKAFVKTSFTGNCRRMIVS